MKYNEPSDPNQDTLDDFVDESTDEEDDEIEAPDGFEERMLDGSPLPWEEEESDDE